MRSQRGLPGDHRHHRVMQARECGQPRCGKARVDDDDDDDDAALFNVGLEGRGGAARTKRDRGR